RDGDRRHGHPRDGCPGLPRVRVRHRAVGPGDRPPPARRLVPRERSLGPLGHLSLQSPKWAGAVRRARPLPCPGIPERNMDIATVLTDILVVLVAAKVAAELAER